MGGSKPAENQVTETPLSRKQLEILRNRESFMNSFTVPELKEHLESVKAMELRDDFKLTPQTTMLADRISGIRDSFQVTQDNLSLNLAKRGLEGSGVEAKSLTQLAGAEAQAVGGAKTQSTIQSILEKNGIINQQNQNMLAKNSLQAGALQNLLSLAPRPTTAAPQQMMQEPGEQSALGGTLGGAMTGATTGFSVGGPWGAVIGGVIGAGAGYASST